MHKTSPSYKVDRTPFPSSPLSRASPRQAIPFSPELECHDHIAPVHLLHGAKVASPLRSTHRNFTESRFSRARSKGFSSPACLQLLTCMCPWYILLCLVQVPLRPTGWVYAGVGALLLCTRLKGRRKKKKSLTLKDLFFAKDSVCPGRSFTAFSNPVIRAAFSLPLFSFLPLPPSLSLPF